MASWRLSAAPLSLCLPLSARCLCPRARCAYLSPRCPGLPLRHLPLPLRFSAITSADTPATDTPGLAAPRHVAPPRRATLVGPHILHIPAPRSSKTGFQQQRMWGDVGDKSRRHITFSVGDEVRRRSVRVPHSIPRLQDARCPRFSYAASCRHMYIPPSSAPNFPRDWRVLAPRS